MKVSELLVVLKNIGACKPLIKWVKSFDPETECIKLWNKCQRPDWMLWLSGKIKATECKTYVKIACQCARLTLHYVPDGELRPLHCIEVVERWLVGEATLNEVIIARDAIDSYAACVIYDTYATTQIAYVAVYVAYAAVYAAYAAVYVVDATVYAASDAAANAASSAAYAAETVVYAAYAAGSANAVIYTAEATIRNSLASIIRDIISYEEVESALLRQ